MSLTDQQLREAIELGDDVSVGAVASEKPYTVTVGFKPKLSTWQQFYDLANIGTMGDGIILGHDAAKATLVVMLTAKESQKIKVGMPIFKLGKAGAMSQGFIIHVKAGSPVRLP
jgi:hypothetical protein